MARRVVFLIFPRFQLLDAAGPIAAFEIAAYVRPGAYELSVVARDPGKVMSSSGAALVATGLPPAQRIDTLVVAGGDGTRDAALCRRTRRFIQRAATRARRVTSVCSGSYLLAAAGLLDGGRATTHWSRTADFRRRFPRVHLEDDRIFVKEGRIWTSAGISAGIDLALALIAADLGEAVARRTAQELVVYYRRPGGQSQFSAMLELERADGRFAGLLDFARENLGQRLRVEDLARRAGMSPRNFARVFLSEVGVTPARAIERLRAETAHSALASGAQSIDDVARMTGFGAPERMRRSFLRVFGKPPSAVKRERRQASDNMRSMGTLARSRKVSSSSTRGSRSRSAR
jgi:transcriptional regulator GlxA family with amidase domain